LIAVASSVAILVARVGLNEALAEQARLLPFVLAVLVSAWYGGLWPGLLATVVCSLLGIYYVVPPENSFQITYLSDALNAITFVIIGIMVSLLCDALHRAKRREAEKQFRTLADSIAQLVWIAHTDGHRSWFNQRWYEYSGATPEQLEGDGWQAFLDPAERDRVMQNWHAAVAKGELFEAMYCLRRKDGQMRCHLARAVPYRDEGGNIKAWLWTAVANALTVFGARLSREATLLDEWLRGAFAGVLNCDRAKMYWSRGGCSGAGLI
jgi:PAS domain S-box-containing protein